MHEPHAPQLEVFFEQHVEPKLPKLQTLRRRVWIGIPFMVGVPLFTMAVLSGTPLPNGLVITIAVVLFVAIGFYTAIRYTRFCDEYKSVVVGPLMRQLDAAAVYEPDGELPQERVTAAGFLPETTSYHCEDVVRGQFGGSAYTFANITKKTGGKKSKLVFHGLFFQAADPRPRRGLTVVVPSGNEPCSPDEEQELDFQAVALAGEDMSETFEAFTTHPDEAAQLLTPPAMATLVRLSDQLRGDVYASFSPGKVSLAASIGDFFEPGFAGALVTKQDVARIATIFSTARGIASELGAMSESHFAHAFVPAGRSDTQVHTHAPDAPSAPVPSAPVARAPVFSTSFSGPLVDAPSLQPLVERLRSRGYGVTLLGQSSLTLEFGTSGRMFLALVLPAFWTLFGLAVHDRATGWPAGGTLAQPLVDVLPVVDGALAWLTQFHPSLLLPLIILIALGVFSVHRRYPRRVVLTPQAVERVGGLLPFTRSRRLDPRATVTAMGGSVSIRGTGLLGITISPPLRPDDAEDLVKLVRGFRGN